MDMDRGILARIDRKLLAGLGDDEALRTVRVPATGAKWSTWKRYCDSAGVSMGRAVAMLIDGELLSVFGEHTGGEWPAFAQRAAEELDSREAKIEARENKIDTDEALMRERSERLRRWEDELETREQRAEARPNSSTDPSRDPGRRSPTSSSPPWDGCTGSTTSASTGISATSRPPNMKTSTMPKGAANNRLETNRNSLQQTQGDSVCDAVPTPKWSHRSSGTSCTPRDCSEAPRASMAVTHLGPGQRDGSTRPVHG